MTVNPDEILIFKMRGMKTVQKKRVEKVEAAPVQQPQPVVQQPVVAKPQEIKPERRPLFAPKPAPAPVAKPEQPKEVPQAKPLFTPKPKPTPQPAEKPVRAKSTTEVRAPRAAETMEEMVKQPTYNEEDEARMRELEQLEQTVALYEAPPGGLEAEQAEAKATVQGKEVKNIFSSIAGLLFIADAIVFGYFIFPQSAFVIGYVGQHGLGSLSSSANYEYGIGFVNIILALLLIISGSSMLMHAKMSHLVSGATGSLILLSVSFEYLNTSAVYLLLVSVITFVSVAVLAYARMSAVVEIEQEQTAEAMPIDQKIDWPRIETF